MGVRRLGLVVAAIVGAAIAAVAASAGAANRAAAVQCGASHWVATWTADPSGAFGGATNDQTFRVMLTPHIGGTVLRVHLSNVYGAKAATFAHATIALRASSAAVVAGSGRALTFDGAAGVTVPAGAEVVSDPVTLTFGSFQDLAVSLYVAASAGPPPTGHLIAREHTYATAGGSGDHTTDVGPSAFVNSGTSASYVDAVDTLAPANVGTVVAFGDSITDGFESSGGTAMEEQGGIDLDHRYPDYLERRLIAATDPPTLSVVNAGISGNRILIDGQQNKSGAAGLKRLDSDVIAVAGVTDAIVLEGTNDIALLASAPQVETALTQIVNRLHAAGIRVQLGTLPPAGTGLLSLGSLIPTIFIDSSANAVRVAVNAWIRSGASGADGVFDFDAALRSTTLPNELNPGFDSGDHVHPGYHGYDEMADTVDLGQLAGAPPCTPPPPPQASTLRVRAGGRPHHDLRVTGSLVTARPVNCTGDFVTVRALLRGRTVLTRNLPLSASCTFAKTLALRAKGRIAVRVGFAGQPSVLLSSHAPTVYARVA